MNILICDDDKICVERMKEYVQDFFRDRKIADYKIYEYFSGEAAARESDIIEQGNHDELMAQNGFYADLYNSQWS